MGTPDQLNNGLPY